MPFCTRQDDGRANWFITALTGPRSTSPACGCCAGTPNAAVLEVNTDITGRKRAEEALHEANERLREQAEELVAINKDLEQFAYVASHDLQEPLRAVGGFVTLLQQRYRGRLDEKADSYIDAAVEGASRMQALINGLLEYSRVGTRGNVPTPAKADDALKEALENLQTLIQESDAVITPDPLPIVQADAIQLTHVFQNLIANAIKFRSERTPEIQVGSRRQDERLALLGARQWHRDRPAVQRTHLPDLSAAAHADQVPRHRHRPGDLQADRRTPWGQHLGRIPAGPGIDVLFHFT